MKLNNVFVVFLFMSLFLASFSFEISIAGAPGYCGGKCEARCTKAGIKDRCLKYCGICCAKCNCVPSGTYGNKHECPCYKNLKNSKGTPKCP